MSETFIARSKQSYWPLLWILPWAALMAWGLRYTFNSDLAWRQLDASGRTIDAFLPMVAFMFLELVLLVCLCLMLWRRWNPSDELVIDGHGLTSNLFWGRGTLAWGEIAGLEFRNTWMYVLGTDARGKKRKLIVNLYGLDKTVATIVATIHQRRPDLFPQPESA